MQNNRLQQSYALRVMLLSAQPLEDKLNAHVTELVSSAVERLQTSCTHAIQRVLGRESRPHARAVNARGAVACERRGPSENGFRDNRTDSKILVPEYAVLANGTSPSLLARVVCGCDLDS